MFKQTGDAARQLVDNLFLAAEHRGHVDAGIVDGDPVHGEVIPYLGEFLAAVEQGLGRYAAYIQAGTPEAYLALVIQPLFNTGGRQAQLGSSDRGHVSGGTRANDNYIVF